MVTKYPAQIDGQSELPIAINTVTPVNAEVVNNLRGAIIAIQSELGADPSREYGTVKARIDALEGAGGGAVKVYDEGNLVVNSATELNFIGPGVVAAPTTTLGRVNITISGGTGGSVLFQIQETIITSNGQTSFLLSQSPQDSDAVEMFVNGAKQQYGTDYTITSSTVTYSGVPMITSDIVEFWYISAASSTFGQIQESVVVTFNGQTSLTLSSAPADVFAVKMFVNGYKQEHGVDYSVSGTTVTWYDVSFTLQTTDVVEFWYIVSGVIPAGGGGENLAATLTIGNTTNGQNINFTGGSFIHSSDGYVIVNDDLYVTGKLTVDGLIDPTGLALTPQVSSPSNNAIWVKQGAPTTLQFTNDLGNDKEFGEALTLLGIPLDESIGNVAAAQDGYIVAYNHSLGKYEAIENLSSFDDLLGLTLDIQSSAPGGTPSAGKATLWIRDSDGYFVVTDEDGNDNVYMPGMGGGVGGYITIENDGTPVAQRDTINLAEGLLATDFGGNTIISLFDVNNSHISETADIEVSKLLAGDDGYTLQTVTGVPTWVVADLGYAIFENNGTPVARREVINLPTGSGLIAADSGEETTLSVTGLTNAHIDAGAAIDVSKLDAGVDGYILQTVIGVPTWTEIASSYTTFENNGTPVIQRTIINLPTGSGLTAADVSSETSLTVANLTNTHIGASAGIVVSKLEDGSAGTVLVGGSPNSFSANPSVTSLTASSAVRSPLYQRASVGDVQGGVTEFFGVDNNSATDAAGDVSVRAGINAGAGPDGALRLIVRREPMSWQSVGSGADVATMDENGNLHLHGPKAGSHYADTGAARVEVTSDYDGYVELARIPLDVARDHIITLSAHFHSDLGEWKRERTWIVMPGSPPIIGERAERDLLTENTFVSGIEALAPTIYYDDSAGDDIVIESPYINGNPAFGSNILVHSVQWSIHFTALGDGEGADRFVWMPG